MISVTILTKNSEEVLKKTLNSVQMFPEVIVYDTGSTDNTLAIAQDFSNVTIHQGPFEGFGKTHNRASALATHDWVLSLDSDEVLTPSLITEIKNLNLKNSKCVYEIARHNFFNEKWIRWCGGWYPDRIVRLYHKKTTRFTEDAVHEKIITDGLHLIPLSSPLHHTPYRTIEQFLEKMQIYSSLFATRRTEKASLGKAILHGWFAFFKSYLLKRGFLGGKEGFIISAYNGHTTFYKYLKLWFNSQNSCKTKRQKNDETIK